MAAGDESALATLYDRWASRVHSVAYWILRDADEVEDVVEETFWEAWRSAAKFNGRRAGAPAWLAMIARSRSLDRLRRHRRRAEWLADGSAARAQLDAVGPADAELPGTHAERLERADGVAAALEMLPSEQQKVVQMAFFGGLSHAEIAAQLAVPLGTVKTRIRLAMHKLRERLAFLREELS
jgi:RNA polymerase sigma-70 factor, ECF subfamily